MKLNKKGFTLVELLAVIVVLAIIALIGYTVVGDVISGAQKDSAANNITQYIHTLEIGCASYQASNPTAQTISQEQALSKAKFNGTAPTPDTGLTFSINATTCKVTPPAKMTSNGIVCTYTEADGVKCGA